ncbi:unnamed protein product, partial [Schistosoma mattheei]
KDCASSWAIASVEALEGQLKRKTGILTPLSSQQLVDCTGDRECVENPVSVAFDYIKEYGVESQEDYPFTGKMVVGGSRQETLDPGFVLLGTR